MAKSIAQLDKEIAYAEGLEAGFAQAQISISEAFNGILTLAKPQGLLEWERRETRLRDERAVLRSIRRGISTDA